MLKWMILTRAGFLVLSIFALLLNSRVTFAQDAPIRITADLTESARRVYHAEIDLPVHGTKATFTSPLWTPGSHSPNGPIGNITGVVFTANGKALPWRRDDVTLSEFHVEFRAGVKSIHAHVDALLSSRATRQIAMLEWETVLLYPAHVPVDAIKIEPAVTVLSGWGVATALTKAGTGIPPHSPLAEQADHLPPQDAITIRYATTNVEQLEDSPVLAGCYFREYLLAPDVKPQHFLDIAGDEAADTDIRPEVLQALGNAVREARADYGSFHYRQYRFLVTRSDFAGGYGGLEHAQSTDIGIRKNALSDEAHQLADADLFAHEFTHSWNGKHRRPEGIFQADFATPVQARLLWIYEGMTQYLGDVLATRAGLKSPERFREMLALTAADLDTQSGRAWRSTEDTAVAVSLMRGGGSAWANWRRGKAYYAEGELLWLDVDTLIRSLTANQKSLDDFERLFLGRGGDTGPTVLPYNLTEVVDDLNLVAPHDWAAFLQDRVASIQPNANLDGIARGGYELAYTDRPSTAEQMLSAPDDPLYEGEDFWYSLGFRVDDTGTVMDVRWGSPADRSKLAPRQKLLTVDGAPYTPAALHSAIAGAAHSLSPLQLSLRQDGETVSANLDYHGGERYPHLDRSSAAIASLDIILKPKAAVVH